MCVFLVCVLGSFRVSACAFRVSELLVVRLSFVAKLFDLRVWFRSFRVEFRIRVFVSNFDFEFFVSLLYSISRISLWSRRRIRFLEFRVEFQIRISRRNFRFVALFDFSNFNFRVEFRSRLDLFDFSNFVALFDFSKSIVKFDFSKFDFSSQVPWISNSSWSIRLLKFRFEFIVELSIRNCRRNCRLRAEFLVWVLHRTSQLSLLVVWKSPICIAILNWRPQLFSHDRPRFALVATRALRALFVRKILAKRQFTCSLYFGIIEL